jgi:CRISPR/Cas system-associated exonuclease Cas4 (RecB family)
MTDTELAQVLSHNRLSTYVQCGRKYALTYLGERPDKTPQGAFLGGIAVHDVIEQIEKAGEGPNVDEDGAIERFRTTFDALISGVVQADIRWGGRGGREDQEWWYATGPGMVITYQRMRELDDQMEWEVIPEMTEAVIGATLDGVSFTGRIDALVATDSGDLIIRDYKTGVYKRPEQRLQLALYAKMMKETLGYHVVIGELCYLRSNARIVFGLEPLYDVLGDWWKAAADGIAKEVYPISPGPMCVSCDVKMLCPWGSVLE